MMIKNNNMPDFEAWNSLGWNLSEQHNSTYVFERQDTDPMELLQIVADYDDNREPQFYKEHQSIFDGCSKLLNFSEEEAAQVKRDIAAWKNDKKLNTFFEDLLMEQQEQM